MAYYVQWDWWVFQYRPNNGFVESKFGLLCAVCESVAELGHDNFGFVFPICDVFC